jgi:hypothetical protein
MGNNDNVAKFLAFNLILVCLGYIILIAMRRLDHGNFGLALNVMALIGAVTLVVGLFYFVWLWYNKRSCAADKNHEAKFMSLGLILASLLLITFIAANHLDDGTLERVALTIMSLIIAVTLTLVMLFHIA